VAWRDRDARLREMLPADEHIRVIAKLPATAVAHDQLVAGFEGSVRKQAGSAYRPGARTRG
jgi:ATP-dependent DNA ligase